MFEKILLPLDGSELAETAIPYVRDLAGQINAEVYLFHVCPPGHQNLARMHKIYLEHMADSLRQDIISVWGPKQTPSITCEVVDAEQPAKAIFDFVQQKSISLVALTSCGASGIRVWALGSVADKVVRGVGIPVLLVRVKEVPKATGQGMIKRILLPLDNSDASRISVPYAVDLAKKLKSSITLFSMSQTIYAQNLDGMGVGIGVNWQQIDDATQKYTDDYLKGIEEKIAGSGVTVNRLAVIGIDAASEILEQEKKIPADIVVMATRGRSPVARWAFGSTAEKLLRQGEVPLLLIKEPSEK